MGNRNRAVLNFMLGYPDAYSFLTHKEISHCTRGNKLVFSISKDTCFRYFITVMRNWLIHSCFLFSTWNLHLPLWSAQTVRSKPPSLYSMAQASLRCNKCTCHGWCFFHCSNTIQVGTSLANYASHFPIAVTENWTETIKGDDTFILVHSNDAGLLWTKT